MSGGYPETDLGNARRLIALYGELLRFDIHEKAFRYFDGKVWALDQDGAAARMAKGLVDTLLSEALSCDEQKRREGLISWARKSQSARALRDALELAKTEPGVPMAPDMLDADHWILNCANGTIDFRTGKLREHRLSDFCSKMAAVEYDPEARDQVLDAFLARVMPDPMVRRFVQLFLGYSLTGVTTERKMLFVHGPTGGGKSTILESVKAILGPYAVTISSDTLMRHRDVGGARGDLARLRGARLIAASEFSDRAKLDEELVKGLVGQDTITARRLYKEEIEFQLCGKFVLVGNDRPRIRHEDEALWDRVLLAPFTESIPPEERDPKVREHLVNNPRARSAMLSWLVEGCLAWRQDGLQPPEAVKSAGASYREDQSPLLDFIEQCCSRAGESTIDALFEAYRGWCRRNDEQHPLKKIPFGRSLAAHGFKPTKVGGKRGWEGISTRSDSSGTDRTDTGPIPGNFPHENDTEGIYRKSPSHPSDPSWDPVEPLL